MSEEDYEYVDFLVVRLQELQKLVPPGVWEQYVTKTAQGVREKPENGRGRTICYLAKGTWSRPDQPVENYLKYIADAHNYLSEITNYAERFVNELLELRQLLDQHGIPYERSRSERTPGQPDDRPDESSHQSEGDVVLRVHPPQPGV